MTAAYAPPWAYRPPLAYGGHTWTLHGLAAICARCFAHVPVWSLTERLWMAYTTRWCPGLVRALPAGTRQLSLFDGAGA